MGRDDHATAPADCLFEEVEVTLDHPGVRMSRPLDRQYQAALEVVVADPGGLDRFTAPPEWAQVTDVIRRLGASRQLDDEVSALFLPQPAHVLS